MRTRIKSLSLLCCFFLALLHTGCDSTNLETLIEEGERSQSFTVEAISLVNIARAANRQCGNQEYEAVAALKWNPQLAEAALAHSLDMATRNFFDHTNPDGEGPGPRIDRVGYLWRTYGENIAAGYASLSNAMEGWMNSPGHCANIMGANFTEFAIGFAGGTNASHGTYWTMVLAAPR